jgi:hypothetical protein
VSPRSEVRDILDAADSVCRDGLIHGYIGERAALERVHSLIKAAMARFAGDLEIPKVCTACGWPITTTVDLDSHDLRCQGLRR